MAETVDQTRHELYERLHATADFRALRHAYRGFAIPWTIAFLSWYLLYVVMSNWANDFMSIEIVGNMNVALVFGVLQFASTFAIARFYATHANKELDPLADKLREQYERELSGADVSRPGDGNEEAGA